MSVAALAPRIICYHKQKTSARTRFLSYGGSVLSGAPLEAASLRTKVGNVRPHLVHHIKALEAHFQVDAGSLRAEPEFYVELDSSAGPVAVLLAEFTAIDPPFAAVAAFDAKFIALTEARNLPSIELALLRKAYEHILG